jgi:hypothetical protein
MVFKARFEYLQRVVAAEVKFHDWRADKCSDEASPGAR